MLSIFLPSVILIFLFFTAFFIIAQIIKNNSIVDIGWGLGFIVVTLYTFFFSGPITFRNILVTLLVFIWGTRLSYHILKRNWGKPEDFRYANWRKEWGKWIIIRGFFQIFMLQGLPMLEKKFTDNPKFQEYARVTPKFFPWFPKKTNHS